MGTITEKETLDTLSPNSYIFPSIVGETSFLAHGSLLKSNVCLYLFDLCVALVIYVCCGPCHKSGSPLHWQGFYYADHVNKENLKQRGTFTSSIVFTAKRLTWCITHWQENYYETFSFSMGITSIYQRDKCLKGLGRQEADKHKSVSIWSSLIWSKMFSVKQFCLRHSWLSSKAQASVNFRKGQTGIFPPACEMTFHTYRRKE